MFSWFHQNNASVVNPKQRLLGTAENVLMQASRQYQGESKLGEVLHVYGPHISLKRLSEAISLLQRRHPVLRSRLQVNSKTPDTYLLEEDETLQLTIREIPRKRVDHLNFWRQEWREREKKTTNIGQGLAEFWLLQDPEEDNDDNSPREIVLICEHSVCDGLSLSTVAHELLVALAGENDDMFNNSLNWPIALEMAIKRSLSVVTKLIIFGRAIVAFMNWRVTNTRNTVRIPLATIDFPLSDMCNYCHTEICYGILNKDETQKLVEKCHCEGVTVTSAVNSAILCTISTLVKSEENHQSTLQMSIAADVRRRCVPPIPNHDLSYQVSCMLPIIIPTANIPTTPRSMWQLAKIFAHYIKTSVDAGQVLAIGMILGKILRKILGPLNLAEVPTCGTSSWGILPFSEDYGRWKLVGMIPFLNTVREVMPFIIFQTVNGILTIVCMGANPVIPLNIMKDLRDGIMQKLHQMIED
ncbi:unnamed protein product [Rotaria magnacalcarata]|uniref:Phthiocerol/phthiodiolone dimycocerosyl transferase C-terminal domain-containing protein n=1 Tax=Rotaria magnacalcarata TaxID=392030 RepID=A0A816N0K4_9BILA|nr:unnamed protein product [Rotaria magnacalcarata]CAF4204042.1 unnamed protein product [Rotaria magnacalcarata]